MFRHALDSHHGRRHARGRLAGLFGDHGRERHHGLRGGRGRRVFDQGDLRFVILGLIAEKPSHGYELIKAIEERLGGSYSPSPGVVYPTLTLLEELGYATVDTSESGKKLYAVTAEGRAFLAANSATLDGIRARMAETRHAQGDGPAPEIVRAMGNLKLALRLRLSSGPLDEGQVRAIAALLDAAAGEVERSR